jgi:hypothetical protein
MAPDGKLLAVEVRATAEGFEHGTPQALFASRADAPTGAISWSYVPSRDGKRFLIRTAAGSAGELPAITVVVNWLAGVRR